MSFDRTEAAKEKILPLIDQLIELCKEVDVAVVVGLCTAIDGHDDMTLYRRHHMTKETASCPVMAASQLFDEEDGHDLAHMVLDAKVTANQLRGRARMAYERNRAVKLN